MLQTLATVFLLGMMSAFAVCAVLLNAGEHARRRRKPLTDLVPPAPPTTIPAQEGADVIGIPSGDRRLPVGDFLFGALALRGSEPLAFPALADAAAGSGMSVAQVLAWVERAETGGLIERVAGGEADEPPAVRLTDAGMELAHNNRRGEPARNPDRADTARA
jgi:hypothetical protein